MTSFTFGATPQTTQSSLPSLTSTTNAFNFGAQPSMCSTPLQTTSGMSLPTLTLTTSTASQSSAQPTSSAFAGLGGPPTLANDGSLDSSSSANKSNKESTYLPPEIMPLVDAFKQFVKEQKLIREENSQQRFSIQPILEVGNDLEDTLKGSLNRIEIEIQRNSKAIDVLKRDTNKLLSNAEMAYRISRVDLPQTPSSYSIAQNKYINANTHLYFVESIETFESLMNSYANKIKDLQSHVENMNKPYSAEELFQIMRKQHETLISLAAKVYALHEELNKLKQQTDAQPRHIRDVDEPTSEVSVPSVPQHNNLLGPNPFSLTGDESVIRSPAQTPSNQTNQPLSIGGQPLFSANTFAQPIATTASAPFQFPTQTTSSSTSHSRAKRWTTS